MSLIQFDEEKHEYRVNGQRLPSVTEILRPLYGDLRFVAKDLLEYKGELGKAVHRAVELHVLGALEYSSLVSPVAEYFEQYLIFEADTGFEPIATEVRVSSPLGYAGTLDLLGMLNDKMALVDLKTTAALSPAVALQTAAYAKAVADSTTHKVQARYALRLTPDKYRLQPYKNDTQDLAGFLGFLNAYRWCQSAGKSFGDMNHVQ